MLSLTKRLAGLALASFLFACGGGGGGSTGSNSSGNQSNSNSPDPVDPGSLPEVELSMEGPIVAYRGERFLNQIFNWNEYTFRLRHSSSDPNVADVSFGGLISLLEAGFTTIDIEYPGVGVIKQYDIEVLEPQTLSIWAGENDSLVYPSASASGMTLYRSRDRHCDTTHIEFCTRGQQSIMTGDPIVDTALTLNDAAYYTIQGTTSQATRKFFDYGMFFQSYPKLVHFKDRLWSIGFDGIYYTDTEIWSSEDGLHWQRDATNPVFGTVMDHAVAVFQGKLWLVGGRTNFIDEGLNNRIWNSDDGVHWELVNANPAFSPRAFHNLIVFNNRLWLIGGGTRNTYYSEVWSSDNGIHWQRVNVTGGLQTDSNSEVTIFNEQLFVTRGNLLWHSSDGIHWQRTTLPLTLSDTHSLTVFNNQLWINTLNNNPNYLQDGIWHSPNGSNWTKIESQLDYPYTRRGAITEFEGKLVFIGGFGSSASIYQPYWSPDGLNWIRNTPGSVYERSSPEVEVFNNRLWLFGGKEIYEADYSDIWLSDDGAYWRQRYSTPRAVNGLESQVVINNGKIWLIPHDNQAFVYSSESGNDWTRAERAPFEDRTGHQVVSFNGDILLIGGFDGATRNDVWAYNELNGWTHRSNFSAFSPRQHHQAITFNGRLWVIGGKEYRDGQYSPVQDVWSSDNGMDWRLETASAAFPPRFGHEVAVWDNRIWLVGGEGVNGKLNDVWSSVDGIQWVRHAANARFTPRSHFELAAFNGKLFVFGDGSADANDIWSSTDGLEWRKAFWADFPVR